MSARFYAKQSDYIQKLNEMDDAGVRLGSSYYGPYAVAPTLRNDGSARVAGDRYFDTVLIAERTWNGTAWYTPNIDTAALAASGGAAQVGRLSQITGASSQNVNEKLNEEYSVLERMTPAERADALSGSQALDHTSSIQAAIDWGIAHGGKLIFPYAKYNVTSLKVKDAVQTFSIRMENPIIYGSSLVAQNGILEIINCVQFIIDGTCTLHAQDKSVYKAGHYVKSQALTSASTTRCKFYGITVRNAEVGFQCGEYNSDFQCSENAYFGCHTISCPIGVIGSGSQSGASFIGCDIVSEANAALSPVLKGALFEGGFWYISGGELVQTNGSAGNVAIEVRPCSSATYGNPYAIVKVSNAQIESAGLLLYLNNSRALTTPYSLDSAIAFSNVSGYINTPGLTHVIDSTADNSYAGKFIFNSGTNFYGDTGAMRSAPHIVLGTNTIIDMDGAPFTQSFLQGLAGIDSSYPGKPRLRGETIVAYSGAVTSIASAASTIVNFPTLLATSDTGYGGANYSAGSYTAPQAMKDVQVSFQVAFATAAANADVWVAVNGVATGYYAPATTTTIRGGVYVIPALAVGDVVTIRANTNTGAAILLSGGVANFLRINART